MPLKSKQQEKFLWATNPRLARKFEDHTSSSQKKSLPNKAKKTKKRK